MSEARLIWDGTKFHEVKDTPSPPYTPRVIPKRQKQSNGRWGKQTAQAIRPDPKPCKNCGRDRRSNKVFCSQKCFESFQKRPKTEAELRDIKQAKAEKWTRRWRKLGLKHYAANPTSLTYYHEVYLRSEEWSQLRKLKLEQCGHCAGCGTRARLHVHHWTYGNLSNVLLMDLDVLCEKHHNAIHRIIDRFPKSQWPNFRDEFRTLGTVNGVKP